MDISDIHIGQLVVHAAQLDWGPGRVLAVRDGKIDVYFRDKKRSSLDEATTTLKGPGIAHLQPAADQHDPWLAALPMRDGKLVLTRPPITRDAAVAVFLRYFPEGFLDPRYLEN